MHVHYVCVCGVCMRLCVCLCVRVFVCVRVFESMHACHYVFVSAEVIAAF